MARTAKLADPEVRAEFIRFCQQGMSLEDAAVLIDVHARTVTRHLERDAEFRQQYEAAVRLHTDPKPMDLEVEKPRRIRKPLTTRAIEKPRDPEPIVMSDEPVAVDDEPVDDGPPHGKFGDTWLNAWADPKGDEPPAVPLGRLTPAKFMALAWARFAAGGKDSARYATLLAPVMLREAILDIDREARVRDAQVEATGGDGDSGLVVLEVPRNAARPHLSAGEPMDADIEADESAAE